MQPRQVTGLESWWGAAAIRLASVASNFTPTPNRLAVSCHLRRTHSHIGQTMDRASRPAGSLGLSARLRESWCPSFRPKAWTEWDLCKVSRTCGREGKFPELVHISQLRAKVKVWLPH